MTSVLGYGIGLSVLFVLVFISFLRVSVPFSKVSLVRLLYVNGHCCRVCYYVGRHTAEISLILPILPRPAPSERRPTSCVFVSLEDVGPWTLPAPNASPALYLKY